MNRGKLKAAIVAVLMLVAFALAAYPILTGGGTVGEKVDVVIKGVDKTFDAIDAVEDVIEDAKQEAEPLLEPLIDEGTTLLDSEVSVKAVILN